MEAGGWRARGLCPKTLRPALAAASFPSSSRNPLAPASLWPQRVPPQGQASLCRSCLTAPPPPNGSQFFITIASSSLTSPGLFRCQLRRLLGALVFSAAIVNPPGLSRQANARLVEARRRPRSKAHRSTLGPVPSWAHRRPNSASRPPSSAQKALKTWIIRIGPPSPSCLCIKPVRTGCEDAAGRDKLKLGLPPTSTSLASRPSAESAPLVPPPPASAPDPWSSRSSSQPTVHPLTSIGPVSSTPRRLF